MALIVGVAVLAWPKGNGGGDGGPLNAIAEAAVKTQNEVGGRALMRAIASSSSGDSFTITGHAVFDADGRTRMVMTAPPHGSHHSVRIEAVGDGSKLYFRSDEFGSLPEGKEWMGLDFTSMEEQESPLPAGGDVKGELALLEAVDDVQKLGKEEVRGVPTTHYRGTLEPADEADGSPLPVEVWIDTDGLVRRMTMTQPQPGGKGKGSPTIDLRIDFYDFGFEPEIDVPESGEVFDATVLAKGQTE